VSGQEHDGAVQVRIATGEEGSIGGHDVPAGALAAFVDGKLAGMAQFHRHFFGHVFIERVYVDERHRRQGIASALLTACADLATTDKVFTSTNRSNLAAQRLFARAGFQASGSIDNLDDGDPELVYCKLLD
jgi:ribosomal protein S18 acetylase RimI-like enzyme